MGNTVPPGSNFWNNGAPFDVTYLSLQSVGATSDVSAGSAVAANLWQKNGQLSWDTADAGKTPVAPGCNLTNESGPGPTQPYLSDNNSMCWSGHRSNSELNDSSYEVIVPSDTMANTLIPVKIMNICRGINDNSGWEDHTYNSPTNNQPVDNIVVYTGNGNTHSYTCDGSSSNISFNVSGIGGGGDFHKASGLGNTEYAATIQVYDQSRQSSVKQFSVYAGGGAFVGPDNGNNYVNVRDPGADYKYLPDGACFESTKRGDGYFHVATGGNGNCPAGEGGLGSGGYSSMNIPAEPPKDDFSFYFSPDCTFIKNGGDDGKGDITLNWRDGQGTDQTQGHDEGWRLIDTHDNSTVGNYTEPYSKLNDGSQSVGPLIAGHVYQWKWFNVDRAHGVSVRLPFSEYTATPGWNPWSPGNCPPPQGSVTVSGYIRQVDENGKTYGMAGIAVTDENGQIAYTIDDGSYQFIEPHGGHFDIEIVQPQPKRLYDRPEGTGGGEGVAGCTTGTPPFSSSTYSNQPTDYCQGLSGPAYPPGQYNGYPGQYAGINHGDFIDRSVDTGYDFVYPTTTIQGAVYQVDEAGNRIALPNVSLNISDSLGNNFPVTTSKDQYSQYTFSEEVGVAFNIKPASEPPGGNYWVRPFNPDTSDTKSAYLGCGPFTSPYSNQPSNYCQGTTEYDAQYAGEYGGNCINTTQCYDRDTDYGYDFVYPTVSVQGAVYTETYRGNTQPVEGVQLNDNFGQMATTETGGATPGYYYFTEEQGALYAIAINGGSTPTSTDPTHWLGPAVRPYTQSYADCPAFGGSYTNPEPNWCSQYNSYGGQWAGLYCNDANNPACAKTGNGNFYDSNGDTGFDFVYYPAIICNGGVVTSQTRIEQNQPYSFQVGVTYPDGYVAPDGHGPTDGDYVTVTTSLPLNSTTGSLSLDSGSQTVASATFAGNGASPSTYSISWSLTSSSGQALSCNGSLTIANLPFFKVNNGGISAGGSFTECASGGLLAGWSNNGTYPGYDFGSSAGFSAQALSDIVGFSSGQTSFGRSPTALSFANTTDPPPGNVSAGDAYAARMGGHYNGTQCLNTADYTSNGSTAPGSVTYNYPGNTDIPTTPGLHETVFVAGDAYISNDVRYDESSPWSYSAGHNNVPSFVLHATGNIYIAPGVTHLDGIYVSTKDGGAIYTCGQNNGGGNFQPVAHNQVYGTCNNQLVVNGSFVADHINLMRTYGTLRDDTPTNGAPAQPGLNSRLQLRSRHPGQPADANCKNFPPVSPDEQNRSQEIILSYELCVNADANGVTLLDSPQGDCTGQTLSEILSNEGIDSATIPSEYNVSFCASVPISFALFSDPAPSGTPVCTRIPIPRQGGSPKDIKVCLQQSRAATAFSAHTTAPNCSNPGGITVDSSTCAAEIFNLSPELYIGDQNICSSGCKSTLKYDALTSLPPVL